MITNIIDLFRQQAKEHRAVKAFYYNRNYELGSGKEQYPLFWLEDPVTGFNQNNVFTNSVNFTVLFVPDKDKTVAQLQNLAFSIGLNILERIKRDKNSQISILPDWTYTTLCDYYDDNACGCRFSVNFTQVNMQNLCLIDEQFDAAGDFEPQNSPLNNFDVDRKGNYQVFTNKLPDFNLRTTRQ